VTPEIRETANGSRFYLHYRPTRDKPQRGAALFVPPFAGEMNRCRHVVAAQARAFVDRGVQVLVFDLFGSGDSAGEFGEATWDAWLADVDDAFSCLSAEAKGPVFIWGMRGGSLLAADWLRSRQKQLPLLLWQPVVSGAQHLQHFLRMRLASGFLGKSGGKESLEELKERLQRDGILEITGYGFSSGLARGLERAELAAIAAGTSVVWVEVGPGEQPALTPGSQAFIAKLRAKGCEIRAQAASGNTFWQIVEREECPDLLEKTSQMTQAWP
jgi:exosortase A-associated hydrolase 2